MDHLDALIHAAGGVFRKERILTEDGLERTFAIQTLARFILTNRLAPLLHRGTNPKVVLVAGGGEYGKEMDFADLQGERTHSLFGSIKKAGVANDLLTAAFIDRHEGITFFNYGPGWVRTKTSMPNLVMKVFLNTVGRVFSRSPEQAGADIVRLVSGDDRDAGFYGAGLKLNVPVLLQKDPGLAGRLWEYCEEAEGRIR